MKYLADMRSRATANSIPGYMKISDQRQRTLKDQTVRRVLKDNKVPGTSAGTRAAEAPARVQGLLQDSWERTRLGCVSLQGLVWTRGT